MAWGRNHFSNIECRVTRVIPEQTNQNGQPESYKEVGDKLLGVSDHFPICVRVRSKAEACAIKVRSYFDIVSTKLNIEQCLRGALRCGLFF